MDAFAHVVFEVTAEKYKFGGANYRSGLTGFEESLRHRQFLDGIYLGIVQHDLRKKLLVFADDIP